MHLRSVSQQHKSNHVEAVSKSLSRASGEMFMDSAALTNGLPREMKRDAFHFARKISAAISGYKHLVPTAPGNIGQEYGRS